MTFGGVDVFDIIQNRRILFGPGKLSELAGLLDFAREKTILVMTYNENAQSVSDAIGTLRKAGMQTIVDASITSEPSTDDIDQIVSRCVNEQVGAVVAIGGGSVMDAAKAVAAILANGGKAEQYQMEGRPVEKPALPLVAVPTTSGTGSEATKVSVVYNPQNHLKKSFYSPSMIASAVILDPLLTVQLPKAVTVSTGVDALSHAIESYVSKQATPLTEMYSLASMRLCVKSLENCVLHMDSLTDRGNMMLASFFGGCALNAGIGLAHIIAQPLGGLIKIPHGVACAIYLPYAMEHNVAFCVSKYCDIAKIFGVEGETGLELAMRGIERVKMFLRQLDAPDSIVSFLPAGFDLDAAVEAVIGATGHIKNDYNPVTREVIRSVIQQSIK